MKRKKITSDCQAMKLWIARNPDYDTMVDGEWEEREGELCLFYDSPELRYDDEKTRDVFTNARMICQIPSYMYPNITAENSPAVFTLETPNHATSD